MKLCPQSTPQRGLIASIAALSLAIGGFIATGPTPANADPNPNPGIVLSDAKLSHVDNHGNAVTRDQVLVGDYLQFSVTYDATAANPKPGDEFTAALPPQLDLLDTNVKKPLKTADGVTAGECSLINTSSASTLRCAFNDEIANKVDVRGTVQANLYVAGTTTESTVNIDLNGVSTVVSLPYDKPIAPLPETPWDPGNEPGKLAQGVSSSSTGITWSVYAPGAWLNANYAAGEPVVVTDTLIPELVPSTDLTLYQLRETCADPDKPSTGKTRVVADATGMSEDGFSYDVQVSDTRSLTLTAKGTWNNQCSYALTLRTDFTAGGTIDKGQLYTNTAVFIAPKLSVSTDRRYVESFSGSIEYREGYGGFGLTKKITGTHPSAFKDQKFTFEYTCSDNQNGKIEISENDGAVQVPAQFPRGTTCTVTESGTNRDGYLWSGNTEQTVTIVAAETQALTFTNDYAREVVPVAPDVNPGMCQIDSPNPTDPEITAPETEGIDYSVSWSVKDGKAIFEATATPRPGYIIDPNTLPDGWTWIAEQERVVFSASVDRPTCSQAATPQSPTVTAGTCTAGATTPTEPTVSLPESEGLTYGTPEITVANGKATVKVTATPIGTFYFEADKLPEGWTYEPDGTATFTTVINQPTCETTVTPVTPTKKPGLPKTGD